MCRTLLIAILASIGLVAMGCQQLGPANPGRLFCQLCEWFGPEEPAPPPEPPDETEEPLAPVG